MYNSQYYTCEQIDERLLQGYLDDYNTQTGQSLTKAQFLTKLGSLFSKEGVIDNTATQIGYYECDTAAGTAAKVLSVASYALFAGGAMKVKFVNKNTANNATLNINSQGAKALYYQGERASATNSWDAEEVVEIYYDGTSYYANNAKFTAAQWAAINSGITEMLVQNFKGKADSFVYYIGQSGEIDGLPSAETYISSDGEAAQMRYIREDDGIYIVFLDRLLNATVYSSTSPESEYFFCDGTKNIYSWEEDSIVRNLYPEFFGCEEGREALWDLGGYEFDEVDVDTLLS